MYVNRYFCSKLLGDVALYFRIQSLWFSEIEKEDRLSYCMVTESLHDLLLFIADTVGFVYAFILCLSVSLYSHDFFLV